MPYKGFCDVCFCEFSLDKFRVLTCGHCFCNECVGRIKRDPAPRCPQCRVIIKGLDGKHIHITLVETIPTNDALDSIPDSALSPKTIAVANSISESLEGVIEIDSDVDMARTRVTDAREGIQRLANVVRTYHGDGSTLERLLDVVNDFTRRIVPAFNKIQSQRSEIERLQNTVTQVQCDLFNSNAKHKSLRKEVEEQKRISEKATQIAEDAKEKWTQASAECQRLQKEIEEKDKEIQKQKGLLSGWATSSRTQLKKIKRLEVKLLTLTTASMRRHGKQPLSRIQVDDSLVVLPDDLDIDMDEPETQSAMGGWEPADMLFVEPEYGDLEPPPSVPDPSHRRPLINPTYRNRPYQNIESDGMPPPNFKSTWNIPVKTASNQGAKAVRSGPIKLDKMGHVVGKAALGSRIRMDKKLLDN